MTLLTHHDVAAILSGEEHHGIEELERQFEKQIAINARPNFHIEQFEIMLG